MNSALIAIIVINVLFSYKGFNDLSFFRKYEFHIGSIKAGEQI
ncbi:MAG: rhomboid family intramembrane serine protease, partial [Flavobacterium sp.]